MATRKNRSSVRRAASRRTTPTRRSATSRRTASSPRPTARRTSTRRASNGGSPWTSTEIAFMRKNYRNQSTSWVARQLGRTVYSVRYKASDLSIKKANPSVWKSNGKNTPTTSRPTSKARYGNSTRRPTRPVGRHASGRTASRTRR